MRRQPHVASNTQECQGLCYQSADIPVVLMFIVCNTDRVFYYYPSNPIRRELASELAGTQEADGGSMGPEAAPNMTARKRAKAEGVCRQRYCWEYLAHQYFTRRLDTTDMIITLTPLDSGWFTLQGIMADALCFHAKHSSQLISGCLAC